MTLLEKLQDIKHDLGNAIGDNYYRCNDRALSESERDYYKELNFRLIAAKSAIVETLDLMEGKVTYPEEYIIKNL